MRKILVLLIVAFVFSLSLPASASDMGLKRLNGQLGLLFPSTEGLTYGVGFQIGAGADLGEITDNLHLVPSLSYWIMSPDIEGAESSGLDASASNFQIAVDLQYYLKDVKGLYFGGGLSLNFKSISIDFPPEVAQFIGTSSSSGSETDVGFGLLAGYEMPFNKKTTGFAHLKYNIISDLNTLAVVFGVWFDMSK
jgi:opacity protein-like surface antigen